MVKSLGTCLICAPCDNLGAQEDLLIPYPSKEVLDKYSFKNDEVFMLVIDEKYDYLFFEDEVYIFQLNKKISNKFIGNLMNDELVFKCQKMILYKNLNLTSHTLKATSTKI